MFAMTEYTLLYNSIKKAVNIFISHLSGSQTSRFNMGVKLSIPLTLKCSLKRCQSGAKTRR